MTPVGPFATLMASTRLPRSEAIALLAASSGHTRTSIVADGASVPTEAAVARFRLLAARREAGEPMAYLLACREFFGRSFAVDPRVLIPRPDSELLIEQGLELLDARRIAGDSSLRVLELGTGSGALAITLALERPTVVSVVATDVSTDALAVARQNASALGAAVRFIESDWFASIDASGCPFDLILSNPPYIASHDPHLLQGDLRFEPRLALTDGADGLTALRHIVREGVRHLAVGGVLMLEHGHDQAAQVRAAMVGAGYTDVRSVRDLAGIERVTSGISPARIGRGNAAQPPDL